MASIADANYVSAGAKLYADGEIFDENDLDTLAEYLQDYINLRKDDLLKLANNAYGNTYVTDGSATPVYNNSLFDKQRNSIVNFGSDFSIGLIADAGFSNVDGSNALMIFTPELTGGYKVIFDFVHSFTLNATSEGQCITQFRVVNSSGDVFWTTTSGGYYPAPAANSIRIFNPIHMEVYQSINANPITYFLQKRNISMTNVSANVVAASSANGTFLASAEKV